MNTLQNIIKELKQGSHLELVNEDFSNEIILNQSVQSSILGDITFFNVDFIGSHVMACNFKNCNFIKVNLTASDFSNFEFIETKFKNSKLDLLEVSLI